MPAGAVSLLLCRRLRRLLHGALHLSSGNSAQLAVPKTGQRVPGPRVRERRGPAHEDHQRSETNHEFLLLISQSPLQNLTCRRCFIPAALSAMFAAHNQPSVDSYIPQRVLSSSISLRSRSDRPPWCEYGSISSRTPEFDIFRLASLGCLAFRRLWVIYGIQVVRYSLFLRTQ